MDMSTDWLVQAGECDRQLYAVGYSGYGAG
jgi:hypothetical protein